jgi:hypothetical protein
MSLNHEVAEERSRCGQGAALTVLALAGVTVAALILARRSRGDSSRPTENVLTFCDRAVRALDERVSAVLAS